MSDAELAKLRDALYCLAGTIVGGFQTNRANSVWRDVPTVIAEGFDGAEERAAIVEFDGGLPRDKAERLCGLSGGTGRRLALVSTK
jgi:hypothetical protein